MRRFWHRLFGHPPDEDIHKRRWLWKERNVTFTLSRRWGCGKIEYFPLPTEAHIAFVGESIAATITSRTLRRVNPAALKAVSQELSRH